jgi:hypothetical protein
METTKAKQFKLSNEKQSPKTKLSQTTQEENSLELLRLALPPE